jgi:hypothetical protein
MLLCRKAINPLRLQGIGWVTKIIAVLTHDIKKLLMRLGRTEPAQVQSFG